MDKKYRLIALDMDGTLLNSQKKITGKTAAAVRWALEQGIQVVPATGRCLGQMEMYLNDFPQLRYCILSNGAVLYDRLERRMMESRLMEPETVERILTVIEKEDVLVSLFIGNRSFMDRSAAERLEAFGLEHFRRVFTDCAVRVEDLYGFYRLSPLAVEKISLYFPKGDMAAGNRVRESLRVLPLTLTASASGNLEITGRGVSKGAALVRLGGMLGVSGQEIIAVGDSGNDGEMLRAAGFAVAMGNAAAVLKTPGRPVAPDCDHDGVAWVIHRFLQECG